MKKLCLIIAYFLFVGNYAFSYTVVAPSYEGRSYDYYAQPMRDYNEAYSQAAATFMGYYYNMCTAMRSQEYSLALSYAYQMKDLNVRWNGKLCDMDMIWDWIHDIKRQMEQN
jgi:hypothetical protein